jgi:hypothetical protein
MGYRILLGDEADVVLIGVQTILNGSADWDAIYTTRSGGELLEVAREAQPDTNPTPARLDFAHRAPTL